jgi:hypothetical protein
MKRDKITYSILVELRNGNHSFDHQTYDLNSQEFIEIINFAVRENLIDRNSVLYADDEPMYECATVTMKGIEYIQKNNKWVKLYKGLKEIRDWLK